MQQNEQAVNKDATFKGFSLFNDIEDLNLRKRNRAVIMTNLLEDNYFGGKIAAKGVVLLMGYVGSLPKEDRAELLEEFQTQANVRGFKIG